MKRRLSIAGACLLGAAYVAFEHPISGALGPGKQKQFPGPPGSIWSNSEKDNGSIYKASGQLVSNWRDPTR